MINTEGAHPSANQPYPWSVDDVITDTLRIKIADSGNPGVWNVTSNDVRVIGKILIVSPDQSEPDWVVGETRTIQFTPTGTFTVLFFSPKSRI